MMLLVAAFFAISLQADASLDQSKLQAPMSPYIVWYKANYKTFTGKSVNEKAKKAGALWKTLSAEKKKTYEEKASKAAAERAAYIAKVKGTEAFKSLQSANALKLKKRLSRKVKIAMHKVPKDKSLKKPLSGYMLWFKDARKTIKGKSFGDSGKKAGEMWKAMAADKKKPFLDRAADAKKKYDSYVSTGKGAAALAAFKAGIKKARAPLFAKSEQLKVKKAAAREKAMVKAAAKREKLKAAKAAKKEKAAAKKAAKKAKKAAMKTAKKPMKKAVSMKAMKAAMKSAMKSKAPVMKASRPVMKASRPAMKTVMKKAKRLIELPDVFNMPVTVLVGVLSLFGITLAMLQHRRSNSSTKEEPLLV